MGKKLSGAMLVMMLSIGFVCADDFGAIITKVDGDKITFQKYKKAKPGEKAEKDGEPVTVVVDKEVKIAKSKFDPDKKMVVEEAVVGGLKSETFTKIDEKKGLAVRIKTKGDDSVVEIIILPPKKPK
jgi:hypothetical protein